ncbi:hypothetical protein DFH06DRAFT_1302758 [Mycena polygramma]|nr:hypothetical protein DFH06DRAFT_1302758 [Mycena polygramma]
MHKMSVISSLSGPSPPPFSIRPSMDDERIESAQETIQLNALHLLGISILYYEHLINIDSEIQYIWMRNKSSSSFWFFLVRYIGFAGNLPVVFFSFMTLSRKGCLQYSFVHQIILVITQFLVSVVAILRTYALYGRNKRLLWCLLILGACLIALSSWTVYGQHAIPVTVFPGCHLGVTERTGHHLSASWFCLFLFDLIIFVLTVSKTYSTRRLLGGGEELPLHMLMVRDGAMYFAAMAFANLANIITYYSTGPLIRGSLSTFANCVSVSMMSRLMLNLHAKANAGVFSQLNNTTTTLDFQEPEPAEDSGYPLPTASPRQPTLVPEPEPSDGISVVPRFSASGV